MKCTNCKGKGSVGTCFYDEAVCSWCDGKKEISMDENFVSALISENIDKEVMVGILSEKVKECEEEITRLRTILSRHDLMDEVDFE